MLPLRLEQGAVRPQSSENLLSLPPVTRDSVGFISFNRRGAPGCHPTDEDLFVGPRASSTMAP